MLKKITVLAMAVGVVAAIALPASASASWKHGHQTVLQQNASLQLTGQVAFAAELGGAQCQVTNSIQLKAGQTTGTVNTFHADGPVTEKCKLTGGLAFCQGHQLVGTNLPWVFHTTGTALKPHIQLTAGEIHGEVTGAFCPASQITVTPATYTLTPTPDDGTTVTKLQIVEGKAHVIGGFATDAAATVTGELTATGTDSGTYTL